MKYDELKKAYEEAAKKCSELESEKAELEKKIEEKDKALEDKDLRIEHLTELVLKRNKMLFGQKSEKGKYICDGQLSFEGIFNEAEEQSELSASEPTEEKVTKKTAKTGKHRGRKEIRADLETKKVVYDLPDDQKICSVCGDALAEYTEEYLTTRLAVIPEKIYKIEYYRKVYKLYFFDCITEGDTTCPSAQIVALIGKAADFEQAAKEAKYTREQIMEMRQEKVKPLLDKVYEIINTLRPGKGSNLGKAVTYAQNQKEKLYLFLDNPDVEMTNNLAERTVKPYVINRKNFGRAA